MLIEICCAAVLKLMKLPRTSEEDAELIIAIAGINRPETNIIKNVVVVMAIQTGTLGRFVKVITGITEIIAIMVNTLDFPYRSDNLPI